MYSESSRKELSEYVYQYGVNYLFFYENGKKTLKIGSPKIVIYLFFKKLLYLCIYILHFQMGFTNAFQEIYNTLEVFFCIFNANDEKPLKILISDSIFHNIKMFNMIFF